MFLPLPELDRPQAAADHRGVHPHGLFAIHARPDFKVAVLLQEHLVQVQPEIESALAIAVIKRLDMVAFGQGPSVHRSVPIVRGVDSRADPLEIVRHHAVDLRLDRSGGRHVDRPRFRALEGNRQLVRRRSVEHAVDVAQVLPKQEIKLLVLRARVLGAIPPAPVAAFRDPKLFLSKAYLLRAQPGLEGVSSKEVAGVRHQVPGFVVLLGANPDVEVGVDPGPRRHMGEDAVGRQLERLRSSDGLEVRVPRHQAIKALQEFPAVARIVLPAVFAVEDHGDHCGTATGAPACSPDALVEVVSGGVGLHS